VSFAATVAALRWLQEQQLPLPPTLNPSGALSLCVKVKCVYLCLLFDGLPPLTRKLRGVHDGRTAAGLPPSIRELRGVHDEQTGWLAHCLMLKSKDIRN
jgi:hypothetical protein